MDQLSTVRVNFLLHQQLIRIKSLDIFQKLAFFSVEKQGLTNGVILDFHCDQLELLTIKILIFLEIKSQYLNLKKQKSKIG